MMMTHTMDMTMVSGTSSNMFDFVFVFEYVYLYIYHWNYIDLYRSILLLFSIPEDGHDHSSDDEEAKTLGSSGAVAFSAGGVILD